MVQIVRYGTPLPPNVLQLDIKAWHGSDAIQVLKDADLPAGTVLRLADPLPDNLGITVRQFAKCVENHGLVLEVRSDVVERCRNIDDRVWLKQQCLANVPEQFADTDVAVQIDTTGSHYDPEDGVRSKVLESYHMSGATNVDVHRYLPEQHKERPDVPEQLIDFADVADVHTIPEGAGILITGTYLRALTWEKRRIIQYLRKKGFAGVIVVRMPLAHLSARDLRYLYPCLEPDSPVAKCTEMDIIKTPYPVEVDAKTRHKGSVANMKKYMRMRKRPDTPENRGYLGEAVACFLRSELAYTELPRNHRRSKRVNAKEYG